MKKFKLDDIERKEPFTTPDKYFDDFSLRMQKRIETTRESQYTPWFAGFPSPQLALTALSIVCVVAVGVFLWDASQRMGSNLDPLGSIATSDLVYFLELEAISSDEVVLTFDLFDVGDSIWNDSEMNLLPQEEMSDQELLLLYDHLSTQDEIL